MRVSEANIVRKKRNRGVLLPLLEQLYEREVVPEDQMDQDFINEMIFGAMQNKGSNRKPMFSPSNIASCLRKSYFSKNWKELGMERLEIPNPQTNGIFANGDWIHRKWQFALWKLHRQEMANGLHRFALLAVEKRIESKRGDHGGTTDAIAVIYGRPYIIDVKGLNFRGFKRTVGGEIMYGYDMQLADYMMLYNVSRDPDVLRWRETYGPVEHGIFLTENKGGPDNAHPLALHETQVLLSDVRDKVKSRIERLRAYEAKKEIPPPECETTKGFQFQGCPFSDFCAEEVKANERKLNEDRDAPRYRISRPRRSDRS